MSARFSPGGLVSAVLHHEELFATISSFASQGSLQVLSMTSRSWLDRAYRVAAASWAVLDMSLWPFAVTEMRQERRIAKNRKKEDEHQHRGHQQAAAANDPCDPAIGEEIDFEAIIGFSADENFWFLRSDLVDARVSDEELHAAVRRLIPGTLQRLVACSSLLTAQGVCRALHVHGDRLLGLCLSDCGSQCLVGSEIQASLNKCTKLRFLELHGVQATPPLTALKLQDLRLGKDVPTAALEVMYHFPNLRTLMVAHRVKEARPEPFLRTFKACAELQEVDIHGAVQVTNEMLACVMEHTAKLKLFRGSGTRTCRRPFVDLPFQSGSRRVAGGALHDEVCIAFQQHFPQADISVEGAFTEMTTEETDCVIS
eukprot:TRINITY_DN26047_c0_g1_i1.p1 TRINITY_DN26047_c0_g1~~TRINITY_DN26047_c0_g1_i1.p1  ORF type:complete len:370 (+),score=50.33 TRINITY_DN26047_c0_g1_i1:54-1163(+)